MSLLGIVFGIGFFVVTQAQTSGFEVFFMTILGTNGAIRVSDRFQDMEGTVSKVSRDGKESFVFRSRENARYVEGIEYPQLVKTALREFPEVSGISEIIEGTGILDSGSRKLAVQLHGLRIKDHVMVSELENQLIQGDIDSLDADRSGILVGSWIAERLSLSEGDRVTLVGGAENQQLRVAGVFETGVSQIDKTTIYLDLATARSFLGKPFGDSVFQVSIQDPDKASEIAAQMQMTLGHRVIGWQEREKVWLEVFKALRFSSAITVSSILAPFRSGYIQRFAIMVIEKTGTLQSFARSDSPPATFRQSSLWQGGIVLLGGIVLGSAAGFLATYGISRIPLRIRGIFSTDSFVVNWDVTHYLWAIAIATVFVGVASWIPARRAAKIEPAKIIRETL